MKTLTTVKSRTHSNIGKVINCVFVKFKNESEKLMES